MRVLCTVADVFETTPSSLLSLRPEDEAGGLLNHAHGSYDDGLIPTRIVKYVCLKLSFAC